jgi:PAS domain S-box-containing protein
MDSDPHPPGGDGTSVELTTGSRAAALFSARLRTLAADDAAGRVLRRFLPLALGAPFLLTLLVEAVEDYLGLGPTVGNTWLVVIYTINSVLIVLSVARTRRTLDRLVLAQHEARSSRERYRNILETSLEGIWTIDEGLNTSYANKRMAGMLGYSPEEMAGRPLSDFMFSEDLELAVARISSQGRTPGIQQRETKLKRRDGSPLYVWISSSGIRETGPLTGYIAMCTDLTERRRVDEELLQSKAFLEEAQELGHIGNWSTDLLTMTTFWSSEAFRMFGFSSDSVEPSLDMFMSNVHAEEAAGVRLDIESMLAGGQTSEMQFRILWPDGSVRWIHGRTKVVHNAAGAPVRLHGIVQDITELKLAELQRTSLELQLRQAQKMEAIGTLAGGIAHDFNNILYAIQGYGEMVAETLPEGSAAAEDQQQVLTATRRATELVKHILAFSRQSEFEAVPVNLPRLVHEVIQLLRASLPSTIEINASGLEKEATVVGDPVQLHQVIMNLCTNAAQAMETSGGMLELCLGDCSAAELEGLQGGLTAADFTCLKVSDTGCGIPPEVIDRIFDPFFTTKEVGKGTGLGLSTVHGIVVGMEGRIRVHSEQGVGTVFTILLPRSLAVAAAEIPVPPVTRGSGQRILLVDDEPALVRMNKVMLNRLGYEVTSMSSSQAALKEFTEHPQRYDLVITDETMPHLTGSRMAQAMLSVRGDIPVILCSGYSQFVTAEAAGLMGIRKYLHKPITERQMSEAILEVVAG